MSAFDASRFDDATLEAASNKGLVRRAQRDVEAGLVAVMAQVPGKITLRVDDADVTVAPGGLKNCRCSCPSRILCRHILAALIFLRGQAQAMPQQEPVPAAKGPVEEICGLDAELVRKAFGRAALRLASQRMDDAPPLVKLEGQTVIVTFPDEPEVRYLAGLGLAGMISKAAGAAAKELHAGAILAVRRLNGIMDDLGLVESAVTGLDQDYLRAVEATLADMLGNVFSGGSQVVEDRLFDLAIAARADNLPNLSARLRALVRAAQAKRRGDAGFDATQTLKALASAYALGAALQGNGTDPALVGQNRQAYEDIARPLHLAGGGLEVWTAPSGARGVTCWLRDLQEPRWLSLSLSRGPGQDASFEPVRAAQLETVWGSTLLALSSAHVVAEGLKASPGGRLSAAGGTAWVQSPMPSPANPSAQWPGGFDHWAKLRDAAIDGLAQGLRQQSRNPAPLMLLPRKCGKPFLDELVQMVIFPVEDGFGGMIGLTLPAAADERVAGLEAALAAGARGILAKPGSNGHCLALTPFAVLAKDGAILSLDFPLLKTAAPTGVLSVLRQRLAGLQERFGPQDRRAMNRLPADATTLLLAAALDDVLRFAELGGSRLDPGFAARFQDLALRCDALALAPVARRARLAAAAPDNARPARMLELAYLLDMSMQLGLALPLIATL